jgi:hypothetical protein
VITPYKEGSIRAGDLEVLMTKDTKDGQTRIHMSVSHANRLPTWEEMKELREKYLPLNRDFIMFFPKIEDYVNIHPYCLHLVELKESDRLDKFVDRR